MAGVEGALEYMSTLNIPMVVVTHSPVQVVDAVKNKPMFSAISSWISRDDYTRPKPAPDGYLVACKKLGISPEHAIGFEDAVRGIESLVAAGCQPVLINANNNDARQTCISRGIPVFSSFADVVARTSAI